MNNLDNNKSAHTKNNHFRVNTHNIGINDKYVDNNNEMNENTEINSNEIMKTNMQTNDVGKNIDINRIHNTDNSDINMISRNLILPLSFYNGSFKTIICIFIFYLGYK